MYSSNLQCKDISRKSNKINKVASNKMNVCLVLFVVNLLQKGIVSDEQQQKGMFIKGFSC